LKNKRTKSVNFLMKLKNLKQKQKPQTSHIKTNSLLSPRNTVSTGPSTKSPLPTLESRLHSSPKESRFKKTADKMRKLTLESESSESSQKNASKIVIEKPTMNFLQNEKRSSNLIQIPEPDELKIELKIPNTVDFSTPSSPKNQSYSIHIKSPEVKVENNNGNPLDIKLDLTEESSNISILDEKRDVKKDSVHLERTPRNSLLNPRRFSAIEGVNPFERKPRSITNYQGIGKIKDVLSNSLSPSRLTPQKSMNEKGGKTAYEKIMKSTNSLFNFGGNKKPTKTTNKISEKKNSKEEISEIIVEK